VRQTAHVMMFFFARNIRIDLLFSRYLHEKDAEYHPKLDSEQCVLRQLKQGRGPRI